MMRIHGPRYTMREYACPDPACPVRRRAEVRPECPDHGVWMDPVGEQDEREGRRL